MSKKIAELVRGWSKEYDAPDSMDIDIDNASTDEIDEALVLEEKHYPAELKRIESQINYLASRLYKEYEVTIYPPHQQFHDRLYEWLLNVSDEDTQKTLFELAPRIFFIGKNEYQSLIVYMNGY